MFRIQIGSQGLAQPKVVLVALTEPETEAAPAPVAPQQDAPERKGPRKSKIR